MDTPRESRQPLRSPQVVVFSLKYRLGAARETMLLDPDGGFRARDRCFY